MHLIRHHHISLKHAWEGIIWAIKTQPNFRVHLTLSLLAIIGGFILKASFCEISILIMAIIFGLGCEMINTSIESMTDLITLEYRQQAKIAKDVAAGMMLFTAFGAASVAILIFLPKLFLILQTQFQ